MYVSRLLDQQLQRERERVLGRMGKREAKSWMRRVMYVRFVRCEWLKGSRA